MDYKQIIGQLALNKDIFSAHLKGLSEAEYRWKPSPDKWSLLEVVCHLYDEEREDFRARVNSVIDDPAQPLTPFDPVSWVTERDYAGQNFTQKLEAFLTERERSVQWLNSLENPQWDNAYIHPRFGPMTARMFLANWLAHDFLHFRQITRLKMEYFRENSGENLDYAGNW